MESSSDNPAAGDPHSWLRRNLRSLVILAVAGTSCYLALTGAEGAQNAILITFTSVVSFLFGERAALKSPGKDT